ncbi:AraC family transcriptional regulator [Cellulomonas sp. NPDC055163]
MSPGATSPVREVVLADADSIVRWHEHDYPHPLARWHTHPEVEIHLIRAGTGLALVGDSVSTFRAGHLVLVGSGVPHDWVSDLRPGEVIEKRDVVLQIHPERMSQLAAVAPEAAEAVQLFQDAGRGLEFSGRTAVWAAAYLDDVGRTRGLDRLRHLFALLAMLARAPVEERRVMSSAHLVPGADPALQDRVDAVLRYVTTNLAGTVRMTEAADIVGMHPSTFSRFFQHAAGRGFASLVRRLRVVKACRLLTDTDMPVAEVCFAVGYTNLSNFNRQFRAETGTTPRAFRRAAKTTRMTAT